MSKGDIINGAQEENPELIKRISSVLKNLPTQREFWLSVRSQVEAMVFQFGPPTFWATFSPGEYDDQELLKYLREQNSDLDGADKMDWMGSTNRKIHTQKPLKILLWKKTLGSLGHRCQQCQCRRSSCQGCVGPLVGWESIVGCDDRHYVDQTTLNVARGE